MLINKMILVIGFPKAGTASFDYLFKNLGYNTLHSHTEDHNIIAGELIDKAIKENKPSLSYIQQYGYDAVTELNYSLYPKIYWPQFNNINNIIQEYDDVIYILNKRNIDKHLKSLKYFEIDEIIKIDNNFNNDIKDIIYNYYDNINKKMAIYDRKYLEYDIDTDDISKLTKYIDIRNITTFPHTHKTIYN